AALAHDIVGGGALKHDVVFGKLIAGFLGLTSEFEAGLTQRELGLVDGPADDVRHDHMGAAFDGLVEHKPCGRGHDPYEEDRGEGPSDGPSEEAETKKDNA
ncbi:MAG: hypothetical protein QGG73_11095, partial [Candidatus Hydrogenedentes bacterium]|nr:hypothetical protein [Candidatus Hydrogenedentota bacterium]